MQPRDSKAPSVGAPEAPEKSNKHPNSSHIERWQRIAASVDRETAAALCPVIASPPAETLDNIAAAHDTLVCWMWAVADRSDTAVELPMLAASRHLLATLAAAAHYEAAAWGGER